MMSSLSTPSAAAASLKIRWRDFISASKETNARYRMFPDKLEIVADRCGSAGAKGLAMNGLAISPPLKSTNANIGLQTKESTRNKYHNILCDYILPEYGERTLDSITYDFIESHCNFLLTSGGKRAMVYRRKR